MVRSISSRGPFSWIERPEGERVHLALQEIAERSIDGSMALQRGTVVKRRGDDHTGEMASARGRSGVSDVFAALVEDLQVYRRELLPQPAFDSFGGSHLPPSRALPAACETSPGTLTHRI
jgi:hypothetical protein